MTRELSVRRGDIVKVDLRGGVGVEKKKVRPCVVVQNDRGNAKAPFTIVVPLTDFGSHRGYPEEVEVPAEELGDGGKRSMAACGQVRQVDKSRIIESAGILAALPAARMKLIDNALRAALSL